MDFDSSEPSFDNDLLVKAKLAFPDEPENDVVRGIAKIKETNPSASDDQVIQIAQKTKERMVGGAPAPVDAKPMEVTQPPIGEPQVKEYVKKIYGDQFSPEARQKIVDQNNEDSKGPDWLAGLAAFGTSLSGGDGFSAGQSFLKNQQAKRDAKLGEFDKQKAATLQDYETDRKMKTDAEADALKARERDVNSPESKAYQDLAAKYVPGPDYSKMTAEQLATKLPFLQKGYEIEQRQLDRQESRAARAAEQQSKRDEKQVVRDEKKKTSLSEVEDRRRNIEDNLTLLEKMIEEDGTYELMGSHNIDLDRRVDMIATDMAKLADPGSVARPSEVEMFKKSLLAPTATGMRNSTALDVIKNFRSELDKRADNAYKIRGIENPGTQAEREGGQRDGGQRLAPGEVARLDTKTGKVAIFDSETKQFKRYK